MNIAQKISLGFAALAITISLFSIFTISLIVNELQEVRDFHSSSLYLIQNFAAKTTKVVRESFIYLASGDPSDKESFLAWADKNNSISIKEFQKPKNFHSYNEAIALLRAINLEQKALNKKAKEVLKEFEDKGYVSNQLLIEYKDVINRLFTYYQKADEIEKEEIDAERRKVLRTLEIILANVISIELIAIILSIIFSSLIVKSISVPANKLKLAIIEVAKGNLDTSIEVKRKDEIGELALSFSQMTENLKRSREELLIVKNYTDNIIRSMSDNLIVISLEGKIITANQAICKLLKYQESELIGQPFENLCLKEEVQLEEAEIDNLIEAGSACKFETIYLAKDGSKIPVFFSSSLMLDDNKQIQGIVCVAQDITERKQAEFEIRAALEKEKQLGELKSRFITMASHEFRTPLATILSSTELLEHYSYKWSEEKKLNHLQRIQVAVKHMTSLLNDVLLIGKAEAGKLEYQPTLCNLVKFCQDIIEEVQAVAGQNHIISFSNEEIDDVFMDEKLLRHILTNLLMNAVKYSPQNGTVQFNLASNHEAAIFSVKDRGIGILPEDQEKLFETFYRGKNVNNIPGTGLGLAIVKKAVDLHNGKIVVNSEVGVGTTFTVTLPLNKQV